MKIWRMSIVRLMIFFNILNSSVVITSSKRSFAFVQRGSDGHTDWQQKLRLTERLSPIRMDRETLIYSKGSVYNSGIFKFQLGSINKQLKSYKQTQWIIEKRRAENISYIINITQFIIDWANRVGQKVELKQLFQK